MKKAIFIAVCLAFVSSSAFAAANIAMDLSDKTKTGMTVYGDATAATATTALIGKTSTGVGVSMHTNSSGYALITQHMNGTKAFGSNYDSTSIASQDVTTVGTVQQQTSAWSDTFTSAGWTAL